MPQCSSCLQSEAQNDAGDEGCWDGSARASHGAMGYAQTGAITPEHMKMTEDHMKGKMKGKT